MDWLLAAAQVILAGTFLGSGIGKLLQPDDFAAALRLSHVSGSQVTTLAVVIPIAELAAGLGVVWGSPGSIMAATVVSAALLALFTSWVAWILRRGFRVTCGCFGASSKIVGPSALVRNLALLGLTGLAIWRESAISGHFLWRSSIGSAIVISSAAMTVFLVMAIYRARPVLMLRPRALGVRAGSSSGERGSVLTADEEA